ncbi:MAG: hypothetical protein ACRCSG_04140 [Cellulosilyticaceae bacterium]
MYTVISKKEKQEIEQENKKDISSSIRSIMQKYPEIKLRIFPSKLTLSYNIYLQTDVIKLLKKKDGIVRSEDTTELQRIINEVEDELFRGGQQRFILCRIDYRLDLVVEKSQERQYLFKLWNKLAQKYSHLKKRNSKIIGRVDNGNVVYHKKEKYKTTLYFSSKALAVCVYNKEEERIAKKQKAKEYEKSVICFEVRLMTRHLAYNAREKKIPRGLDTYLKEEYYNLYIRKYIINIFGRGDFYKINTVRKRLYETSIKQKEQEKIIDFLKAISKKGIEGSIGYRNKASNKKGYSRYLIKKYKNYLEEIKVNIILLPTKWLNTKEVLRNPLKEVT